MQYSLNLCNIPIKAGSSETFKLILRNISSTDRSSVNRNNIVKSV